jgi:hypothetical protein
MGQALTDRLTGLSAGNARGALLGSATLVVAAVAVALVLAGVTTGEVAATALFLPVFGAGVLGGRPAGYAGAAVATLVYVALRRTDLASAGAASAGVLTLTRAAAYLVAGHVGALAQALMPGADAGAARPRATRGRFAEQTAGGRRPSGQRADAGRARRPLEHAWDPFWDADDERVSAAAAYDRGQPVLAGVGSQATGGYPYPPDEPSRAPQPPTTMSGAWPPDPPREPWRDEGGAGPSQGSDAGDRDEGGSAGWQGGDAHEGRGPAWPAADDAHPLEDDSWAAVQQSWRQQHGVPLEDERPVHDRSDAAPQGWPHEAQGHGGGPDDRTNVVPPDPWDAPGATQSPPSDPWAQPPQADAWGQPAQTDPWAEPAPDGDAWDSPAPPERWSEPQPAGHEAQAWPAPPGDDPWGAPRGGNPAPPSDPWGDAAPTGGTWPQPPPPPGAGPPHAPAPDAAWAPPQPASDEWGPAPPGPDDGWGGPTRDAWPAATTGPTEAALAPPAPGYEQPAPSYEQPAGQWSGDAQAGWAATSGGAPTRPPAPQVPLPAVDPETGLWTAKFLRDRLTSERARSRRSGHPFSLVLVQVPDGPLAQLPYRRQLTLLRELGYQFVAGGVVDHLVHVPDQAQHWFAVILPDTDRSGAQVLERRLRLGIGGYLSSRGLRLRDLESASLTAPDDDPAMSSIWEALIGPDEAGSSSMALDY